LPMRGAGHRALKVDQDLSHPAPCIPHAQPFSVGKRGIVGAVLVGLVLPTLGVGVFPAVRDVKVEEGSRWSMGVAARGRS
jgi:hypothetical protein